MKTKAILITNAEPAGQVKTAHVVSDIMMRCGEKVFALNRLLF